ncbi:UBN2 domain-containing protein [Tanacetum coccineum]
MDQNGTSLNTKFAKPSTSGSKLYSVTPFPKTQFIPKFVEKIDLSKTVTSHLQTNKVIEKCTKVLAPDNSQVKDNKIDLLVQQYEQLVISEDESIDSAFARFNTIITSLKALDEGYSSKNYVRKFLKALHPIRILLAYACALDFKLFQMDVKSAFLNGFINEEVYVAQPPGFIDFEKPDCWKHEKCRSLPKL